MTPSLKALTLIAMGLFLYSRFFGGTLLFYINERFVWLTLLASLGFILVGASYRYRTEHNHEDHAHGDHSHGRISWGGFFLVVSPIILGLLVPPKPLGAAAMVNRDISIKSLTSASAPETSNVLSKPKGDKNILDWLIEFRSTPDLSGFDEQQAKLVGFVYRDERFGQEQFMVSRFVLSCCAADAAPIGIMVESPESASFADDQWVEVSGHFKLGQFAGEEMPILMAQSITPTGIPEQPYLYPY
jgi:uncharacterized repeat protein (TIGR03943 family)